MDLAFGWLSEHCLIGIPSWSLCGGESYRIAPLEKRVTSKCKFFSYYCYVEIGEKLLFCRQ